MKAIFENSKKPLLSIFTTAGFPHKDDLNRQLKLMEEMQVDFVEIGIPFSDPLADGPTIQETSTVALKNGMNLSLFFLQLEKRKTKHPVVLMGYFNPILLYGLNRFLENCLKTGISGLIIPDLEIDLFEKRYSSHFEEFDIPVCFLVTPKTSDERINRAARLSARGFVYLVSSNSITGGEISEDSDLSRRYQKIKALCEPTPVMIGFGITDRASFERSTRNLDGGIIGSAYLKALKDGAEEEFLEGLNTGGSKYAAK
ncbi:MAG: tryptophan synthase subunit alpha [Brumimicrobium sp.]|nr:tryptophan synthase subunit alpha [Brumimicrobium sp.]